MAVTEVGTDAPGGEARKAKQPKPAPLLAADGTPLRKKLRQALMLSRMRAFALVAPLLLFILIAFVIPIFAFMVQGFYDNEYAKFMPRSTEALADWDGESEPTEEMYAAMVADLVAARDHPDRPIGRVATRVNRELSGTRSLFTSTARKAARMEAPFKDAMIKADKDWADIETWQAVKVASTAWTPAYYAASLDFKYTATGDIVRQSEDRRIHVTLFLRTLEIAFTVTVLTILLGYPVAWLMANLPLRTSNLLLILVLLPFWTSILVRTTAWIAMLQGQGVLNDVADWSGINSMIVWAELRFAELGDMLWPSVWQEIANRFDVNLAYDRLALASLCANDVNQVLNQGQGALDGLAQRAAADLTDCATEMLAIYNANGVEAAVAKARELKADAGFAGYGDERFSMIYNKTGTLIAMTHILLPFMVLPLYSVMKTIKPSYLRAAKSLGATNWVAFWRVYFPQSVPGIGAGALLVFILAIGYYITPALVGGQDGQMISNFIDFHMRRSLNWPLAAAMGGVLLIFVLFFYWLYDRIVGIDNMKLG